jgi:Protein of unknown function (DUF3168)
MKDIRGALRTFLLADAAINAIVTTAGVSRIYPGILPQGITATSIVQNLVSELSNIAMDGPTHLGQARVQLDCWALTQDAAVALANLVMDRLNGHRGIIAFGGNSPQDEIVVKGVFHDQGLDDYDSVAKMHRRSRDYLIHYSET